MNIDNRRNYYESSDPILAKMNKNKDAESLAPKILTVGGLSAIGAAAVLMFFNTAPQDPQIQSGRVRHMLQKGALEKTEEGFEYKNLSTEPEYPDDVADKLFGQNTDDVRKFDDELIELNPDISTQGVYPNQTVILPEGPWIDQIAKVDEQATQEH